jgi:hypothetical protein
VVKSRKRFTVLFWCGAFTEFVGILTWALHRLPTAAVVAFFALGVGLQIVAIVLARRAIR